MNRVSGIKTIILLKMTNLNHIPSLISIHRQFLCFYFESAGTVNIAGHARVFTVDSSMAASLLYVTITLEFELDRLEQAWSTFDSTSA